MFKRYKGQEDDICYGYMAMSWREDIKESSKMKSFLFSIYFNWVLEFVLFYYISITKGHLLICDGHFDTWIVQKSEV